MRYNITGKASLHTGKKYCVKHNLRNYDPTKWNTDGHIQSERSNLNIVLTNIDLKTFFENTFGNAIEEYNQKNNDKHPERVMSVNDYYKKYKSHAQECIMQMGNHENYIQLVGLVGQERADQIHIEFLKRVYENWLKDNPSLKVFSATIHMDETKEGTPHIHLDYLPVAESTRGLTVKVSMDGAMKQLGFNRKTKAKDGENDKYADTPFKRWLAHQRLSIETLANNYMNIQPSEPYSKQKRQETWEHRANQKKNLQAEITQLTKDKLELISVPKRNILESQKAYEKRTAKEQAVVAVKLQKEKNDTYSAELNKRAEMLNEREQLLNDMHNNIQHYIEEQAKIKADEIFESYRKNAEQQAEDIINNAKQQAECQSIEIINTSQLQAEDITNKAKNQADTLLHETNEKLSQAENELNQAKKRYDEYISDFITNQKTVIQNTLRDVESANKEMIDYFKENMLADGRNAFSAFEQDYQKKKKKQLEMDLLKEKPIDNEPVEETSLIQKLYRRKIYEVGTLVRNGEKVQKKYIQKHPYSVENDYEVFQLAMQLNIITRDNISSINQLEKMLEETKTAYENVQQELNRANEMQKQFQPVIENAEICYKFRDIPESKLSQSDKLKLKSSENIIKQSGAKSDSDIERIKRAFEKNKKIINDLKAKFETLKERYSEYADISKKYKEITQLNYIDKLKEEKQRQIQNNKLKR